MSDSRDGAEREGGATVPSVEQAPGEGRTPDAARIADGRRAMGSSAGPEPAPAVGLTPAAPPAPPLAEAARPLAQPVPPTPDVAPVEAESVLPGRHRGGFQRLPTAPLDITLQSAPADPDGDQDGQPIQWILPPPPKPTRGLSAWALVFAILALVVSLFVGWGFPLGIVAIVAAILALRRPIESRSVAVWAIVLGALSILYSAGWLLFAATSAGLIA